MSVKRRGGGGGRPLLRRRLTTTPFFLFFTAPFLLLGPLSLSLFRPSEKAGGGRAGGGLKTFPLPPFHPFSSRRPSVPLTEQHGRGEKNVLEKNYFRECEK